MNKSGEGTSLTPCFFSACQLQEILIISSCDQINRINPKVTKITSFSCLILVNYERLMLIFDGFFHFKPMHLGFYFSERYLWSVCFLSYAKNIQLASVILYLLLFSFSRISAFHVQTIFMDGLMHSDRRKMNQYFVNHKGQRFFTDCLHQQNSCESSATDISKNNQLCYVLN